MFRYEYLTDEDLERLAENSIDNGWVDLLNEIRRMQNFRVQQKTKSEIDNLTDKK
jgi:hypothetical protein